MPPRAGEVLDIRADKKLAVVWAEDWTFSVIGWVNGTPLDEGDLLSGDMLRGGWSRLTNTANGVEFMAYKHLTGCSLRDAVAYCGPE